MINYSSRFSFERDAYNWLLHDWRDGEDKDGNATRTKKTSYHPSLAYVCKEIIDRSAGECESLEEVLVMLSDLKGALVLTEEK